MSNLPPNYVEENTDLSIEQEDLIAEAENVGLTCTGVDAEGELEFIGEPHQFTKFEKVKENL
jgi:hypothetical protein